MIFNISNHLFDVQYLSTTGGDGRAQQEGKAGYQQGQEVLGPLITLAKVEDPALAHALGCHLRGQQSVVYGKIQKELLSLIVMHAEQRLHFSVAVMTLQLAVVLPAIVTDLLRAVLQS